MKVAKWGNSLAVRLPAEIVDHLSLKTGDEIEVRRGTDVGTYLLRRKKTPEEMWEAVRKLRGAMPKDFKFNRDEIYDE